MFGFNPGYGDFMFTSNLDYIIVNIYEFAAIKLGTIMFKIFKQIFAKEFKEEIAIPNKRMHHCSTICKHKNGVLIAFYAGSNECADDQSVYISYNNNHERIGDETGNPVLWDNKDYATLLWSEFDQTRKFDNIIDKWKHCSLWIRHIKFSNKFEFVGEPVKILGEHLLGRCQPLSGKLLPLYDELRRYGVIYHMNGLETTKLSIIGTNMIQPTIWEQDGILCSLSRNFGSNDTFAKFSYSTSGGIEWSRPKKTLIRNNNSSLCTTKWGDDIIILWNDTDKRIRSNLTIGCINLTNFKIAEEVMPCVESIEVISSYGSYPSMCVDKYDRLHMTFTNKNKKIEHHVWNRKYYNERRRNSYRSRCGNKCKCCR